MKKYFIIAISILLLAAACSKQPVSVVPQPKQQSSADITIQDLVSYFNSKFADCSEPKTGISKICFDQNFKSTNAYAMFSDPQYQLVDFTGDGAKDALVTIVLSGTGEYREFYAISKDPSVSGTSESASNLKVVYSNNEARFPRLLGENSYTIVCPYVTNALHKSFLGCTVNIKWDIKQKKFVEINKDTAFPVKYDNKQYGFVFSLPDIWQGYSINTSTWEGYIQDPQVGERTTEHGPVLIIRNPKWTQENPWQDIPVMVFTIQQWTDYNNEKFYVGAAPVGPSLLGRNSRYVFALPARYNFADATGIEEVSNIVDQTPLQAY